MVTKPTGKPVGRPRKPRPTRRPKAGRPLLEFRDDPDRYAIALLDALLALGMSSERACSLGVATWVVGLELNKPRPSPLGHHIITTWANKPTRSGATAGTLKGKAATLRIKQRRCRSAAEGAWRKAMGFAFMLVIGARDQKGVKPIILQRAAAVGEEEFAKRVMLPMVDAKFAVPEFPANLVSTTELR
jgi:hypothetical protein